jgi:WD40 repeat protein
MRLFAKRSPLSWLLVVAIFPGCDWGAEAVVKPEPVEVQAPPPTKPAPPPEEEKPPYEIVAIAPVATWESQRLKLPYSHGGVHALGWAPGGDWVAGGTGVMSMTFQATTRTKGGDVLVWNLSDGSRRKLGSHGARVDRLLVTPDGTLLISVSRENGRIKFWEMPTGKSLGEASFAASKITVWTGLPRVQLSRDGSLLAVVTKREIPLGGREIIKGGDLVVWDTSTREPVLHWRDTNIEQFDISPLDRRIVAVVGKTVKGPEDRPGSYRSHKYLTAWKDFQEQPYFSEKMLGGSKAIILESHEGVVKTVEAPSLDYLLTTYDLATMQKSGATKLDWNGRPSDFVLTPAGGLYITDKTTLEVFDSSSGDSQLRVEMAKLRLRTYGNVFSTDLRYMAPATDLDYIYLVRFRPGE